MLQATHPVLPWWRVRLVWLVIAGPALVVVAGITTAVIAVRGADPELRSLRAAAPSAATAPAIAARNHAATPQP